MYFPLDTPWRLAQNRRKTDLTAGRAGAGGGDRMAKKKKASKKRKKK